MSGCMRAAKTVQRGRPSEYGLGAVGGSSIAPAQVPAVGSDLAAQPRLLTEDTVHCIHGGDFDKFG